jgi:hypothetical protein
MHGTASLKRKTRPRVGNEGQRWLTNLIHWRDANDHQQFYFQVLFSLPTLPLHLAHPIPGKHLHDSVYVYFHRKGLQPTKDVSKRFAERIAVEGY